jgi:hypothetical protein
MLNEDHIEKRDTTGKQNEEKRLIVNNENSHENNSASNDINKKSLDELTIEEKIKLTAFLVLALALLRIFTLDLLIMLGEIVTSIIVYFYSLWNNKCMAIVVSINGISGFIFSFIRIFIYFFTAKSESFGYASTMGLIISIFATGVYGLILYFGYYGLKNFQLLNFGKKDKENENNEHERNRSSEYGAIGKDTNNNPLDDFGTKAKNIGNNLVHIGNNVEKLGKNLNKL